MPSDPSGVQRAILGTRSCRVPRNGDAGRLAVPMYAGAGPTGFAGGFEVKVDGPATGKLVLVRLVVETGAGGSADDTVEVVRFVSCADG